jgi:hypothetical protein
VVFSFLGKEHVPRHRLKTPAEKRNLSAVERKHFVLSSSQLFLDV